MAGKHHQTTPPNYKNSISQRARSSGLAGSLICRMRATTCLRHPARRCAASRRRSTCEPTCPPVYDQGQLGSCTGNAIAGAIQFDREKQSLKPDFVPSRLFIYYNERVIEGTVSQDSGAQIRDGIKSVAQQGVPAESDWPYDITKFAQKPPSKAYSDAALDKAVSYKRVVQTLAQLKSCLASGYPFVFGFTVYESFESHRSLRPAWFRFRTCKPSRCWAATPCWPWVTTTVNSNSSCVIRGARTGG